MNFRLFTFAIVSIFSINSSVCQGAQGPGAEVSLKLFKSLAKGTNENFVVSPYAIRMALGMTASGARGKTQRQLGKAPEPWVQRTEPSYKLHVANRLWVQQGFPLLESYMEASDKAFGVRPWMVDFTRGPDFLRDRVNGWVAEKTQGKIKSQITEDSVDASMKMMLTSASYFRGDWVYPFDKSDTEEGKFYAEDGKVKVPYLHRRGTFNYQKINDHQLIELPYLDGEIALVIIIPSEEGLSSMEQSLKAENLDQWFSSLELRELNLYIPRFEFNSHFELKEHLRAMGVVDLFDAETADFSGMTGKKDLFLSSFYHRAFVGLTEEGTEAGSHSGAGLKNPTRTLSSVNTTPKVPSAPILVKADRPFTFMIRHRGSNSILFLGHVTKPSVPQVLE